MIKAAADIKYVGVRHNATRVINVPAKKPFNAKIISEIT